MHRCREGGVLPQEDLPVEGELLLLLQGAPRPGEKGCREARPEEAEGGQGPPEGPGAGQEAEEALPDRQRPDQGHDLTADEAHRDHRGGGAQPPPREGDHGQGGLLLPGVGPGHGPARSAVQVPVQGRGGEAVLVDEVGHRNQAHQGMDGRRRGRRPPDRFPRPGDGLRDTFPVRASILDGYEIHHGCHAEVDTYGGAQEGRREEVRPVQFHASERVRSEMLRPLFGGSDHVNPVFSGISEDSWKVPRRGTGQLSKTVRSESLSGRFCQSQVSDPGFKRYQIILFQVCLKVNEDKQTRGMLHHGLHIRECCCLQ